MDELPRMGGSYQLLCLQFFLVCGLDYLTKNLNSRRSSTCCKEKVLHDYIFAAKWCLEDPKLFFGRRFSRSRRLLSFVAAILHENFNPCSGALPKIIGMNFADNHAVFQTNGTVPLCDKALGQPSLKPMVVRCSVPQL